MPTANETLLLDTSAAIALAAPEHAFHNVVVAAVGNHPIGLAGHAAFEFVAKLTSIPVIRTSLADAVHLASTTFPETRYLDAAGQAEFLAEWGRVGRAGGAVHDGLIAAAARAHGLPLVSCDRRAEPVYRAVGADLILVDPPVGPESG
jgi:predicted nucleic acid-binding protein